MEDTTIGMILASVIGAAAGIYYATTLNPVNNYIFLVVLFAMIGIGVANLVFLVLIGGLPMAQTVLYKRRRCTEHPNRNRQFW